MHTKIEVLENCRIEGNVVKLPPVQLEKKLYVEVAKSLEIIGGKWKGGKTMGFIFPSNPEQLLMQLKDAGDTDLKKDFQFFETPDGLADTLVQMAGIEPGHSVLEPSAGQGALVKAVQRLHPGKPVDCYEAMETNRTILSELDGVVLLGDDFMETEGQSESYNRIVANPPFSKNRDIDHIRQMYRLLNPKGILVSVCSKHWVTSEGKKEMAFKSFLAETGAEYFELQSGIFKESGTMVATCVLVIRKPSE